MLVFGAFTAGIAALFAWAAQYSAKTIRARAASLETFGAQYGMHMVDALLPSNSKWQVHRKAVNFSAKQELPAIGFLQIHNCRISNVLEGRDDRGRLMRTLDAQYTVSTGKSSTTYYFTIASVDTGQPMPEMSIQREGLWDKVKRMFGNDDIKTGNAEFDKTFRLECTDEAFARSLIMSEMQDRIKHQPFHGLYLTAGKAVVVKWSLASPEELGQMLDLANIIAERAARPEDLSRVRYALEHSGPAVLTEDTQALEELE